MDITIPRQSVLYKKENGEKKLLEINQQRLRQVGIRTGDTIFLEPKDMQVNTNAFFQKAHNNYSKK